MQCWDATGPNWAGRRGRCFAGSVARCRPWSESRARGFSVGRERRGASVEHRGHATARLDRRNGGQDDGRHHGRDRLQARGLGASRNQILSTYRGTVQDAAGIDVRLCQCLAWCKRRCQLSGSHGDHLDGLVDWPGELSRTGALVDPCVRCRRLGRWPADMRTPHHARHGQ